MAMSRKKKEKIIRIIVAAIAILLSVGLLLSSLSWY